MTPDQSKIKFKECIFSIVVFTILVVVFTFPLITGFRTHIAGFGDDNWGNIWNLSWVSQVLVSNADLYQTPMLFIKVFRKRTLRKCFIYIISTSVVFFIAVSPIIVQAVKESLREGPYYQSPPRAAKHWGADLYSFVTPPNFHWFFRPGPVGSELSFDAYISAHRPWFNGPVYSGKGSEAALYLGIPVFLLALLGIFKAKNLKHKSVWIITGICFLILSLGPVLIIKGHVLPENPERFTHYPLPFAYLMDIPIFGALRMPARCHAVTSLIVSLLASAGLHHLLTGTKRKSLKVFLFAGIFFVSAVDFASMPWPCTSAEIPEVYQVIRDDHEPGSVLDLPSGWRTGDYVDFTERTVFQYYQTYHQHPIPYGQVSRVPRWKLDYFNRNLLLNWFRKASLEDKSLEYPDFARQWAKTTSEVFDVSFIVVHKNAYIHNKKKSLVTEKKYQLFCRNISSWFDAKQIIQSDDETLFQIEKKVADKGKYIKFSRPWSSVYIAQGISLAWSPEPWIEGDKALLLIPFKPKTSYIFKIQVRSFQGKPNDPPQTMTININDCAYKKVTVSDKEWQNIKIDIPSDCITRIPTHVNMEFSRVNSPWELWREPDIRDLAVQIKSMEWQPVK